MLTARRKSTKRSRCAGVASARSETVAGGVMSSDMRTTIREAAGRAYPGHPPNPPGALLRRVGSAGPEGDLFDAVLHGEADEFVAAVELELAQDVADVVLDGLLGNEE